MAAPAAGTGLSGPGAGALGVGADVAVLAHVVTFDRFRRLLRPCPAGQRAQHRRGQAEARRPLQEVAPAARSGEQSADIGRSDWGTGGNLECTHLDIASWLGSVLNLGSPKS